MNKVKSLLFLLLICITIPAMPQQKEAMRWMLGRQELNFSTSPPHFTNRTLEFTQLSRASSYCDKEGNLLFYSDGANVFDRNNNVMPNGILQLGSFPAVSSSTFVIPKDDGEQQYYMFYHSQETDGKLRYCLIDMAANNGLGDVLLINSLNNVNLKTNGEQRLRLAGVKNATIVRLESDNVVVLYVPYEFTDRLSYFFVENAQISTLVSTQQFNELGVFYGDAKFSPDGKTVAIAYDNTKFNDDFTEWTGEYGIAIFPFNESLGLGTPILFALPDFWNVAALGFSQDASKLYYSQIDNFGSGSRLLQLDLNTGIKTKIWETTDVIGDLQLGIDNKIYVRSKLANGYLSVIHQPNMLAETCNFEHEYISLQNIVVTGLQFPVFLSNLFLPKVIIKNTSGCTASAIPFEAELPKNVSSYYWELDDNTTSTQPTPTHTYTTAGDYTVTLTVTYADNTTESTQKTITIYDRPNTSAIKYEP